MRDKKEGMYRGERVLIDTCDHGLAGSAVECTKALRVELEKESTI